MKGVFDITENDVMKSTLYLGAPYTGRRKITTNYKAVTPDNVVDILTKALSTHANNEREIDYLYAYYKGSQDIRNKTRPVRDDTNTKVTMNRANEIVTFKSAYLLGEPIQYVSHGDDDRISEEVNRLNMFMRSENKESSDKEISDWMHICGVALRMVLPETEPDDDEAPFNIYTLDPRQSFVVYFNDIDGCPALGVIRQVDENDKTYYCAYSADSYYEIRGNAVTRHEFHALGHVPVVEYLNNTARLGAFEVVLPLLNAINTLESNRVDNVVDFVNSYDVFENCEISQDDYKSLGQGGMRITIKSTTPGMPSKVYRIGSEMNQGGTQTVVDDLYDAVLTICGMPNRNGGSSTSDTGMASMLRDGWTSAESRAKDTETSWRKSEREFLRLALRICRDSVLMQLKLSEVGVQFTRKNLTDIQSRTQVLCQLLANDKVHPKYAWQFSGIVPDAEEAYRTSMDWYTQRQQEMEDKLQEQMSLTTAYNGGDDGGASV